MGPSELVPYTWLALNHDPPDPASKVAGITGMTHHTWLSEHFLMKNISHDA
jgi:hypothetical protein